MRRWWNIARRVDVGSACVDRGLHAFSYNFAESEPIWMKSGTVSAKCWGLALADFGRDPRSSKFEKQPKFCPVNKARFPAGQILHLNTTSIGKAKTFGREF